MFRGSRGAARFRDRGGPTPERGRYGRVLVAALLLAPGLVLFTATPPRWPADPGPSVQWAALAATVGPTATLPDPGVWSVLGVAPGQPTARSHFALAFDPKGGLGVLFGGVAANGSTLNDTWVNDGDLPTNWIEYTDHQKISPPPLADASLAFEAATGTFLLFGGRFSNGSLSGATWRFADFQWSPVPTGANSSPPPQAEAPFVYDSTDGYPVLESSAGSTLTWRFQSGAWSPMPGRPTPTPRQAAALVDDPVDGGVVLFGGSVSSGALNDTWTLAAGQWHRVNASGPPAVAAPRLAYDPRGPIVVLLLASRSEAVWGFGAGQWSAWTDGSSPGPTVRTGAGFYYDSIGSFDILFGGIAPNGTTLADKWGWNVPPSPAEPTLGSAAVPPGIAGILVAVAAGPIVIAWWLRRRPPRFQPVSVPTPAPGSAGI